jgi:hypothetical protein
VLSATGHFDCFYPRKELLRCLTFGVSEELDLRDEKREMMLMEDAMDSKSHRLLGHLVWNL